MVFNTRHTLSCLLEEEVRVRILDLAVSVPQLEPSHVEYPMSFRPLFPSAEVNFVIHFRPLTQEKWTTISSGVGLSMDMDRISHRGERRNKDTPRHERFTRCMVGYEHMIDEIVQESGLMHPKILR